MTTHPGPSVDWLTAHAGQNPLAYAAKWAAAATSVAGAMAALAMLTLWLSQGLGNQNAIDSAVLIDMAPLPEAPPAIATLEPAPEVPMAELPETLDPVVQDEPLPDLPDPTLAPDLPDPVVAPQPLQADLPPDAEAPPEKPKPEPVPEEKPAPKKPKPEKTKPAAKAQQQPQAEQKAATAVSKGKAKSLVDRWGAQVRKKVERRKTYPRSAAGAEGIATVRITVTRSGGLAGVSVARSSGNAALDQAALQAVNRAGSFPAAPDGLTDAQYSFNLQVSFKN
ncbi:MAG: TonB family protein [Pseudomonadota bacterium]